MEGATGAPRDLLWGTKLLADYGDCGKPVCCNTHLTRMPPVSMRMASHGQASTQ